MDALGYVIPSLVCVSLVLGIVWKVQRMTNRGDR